VSTDVRYADDYSPNANIDKALEQLMKGITKKPADIQVKILAQAINWERVKAKLVDKDEDFNPDEP
jgi:hypothetical protein